MGEKKKYFAIWITSYQANKIFSNFLVNKYKCWGKSNEPKRRHKEVVTGNSTTVPPCCWTGNNSIVIVHLQYSNMTLQRAGVWWKGLKETGWQAYLFLRTVHFRSLQSRQDSKTLSISVTKLFPSELQAVHVKTVLIVTYQDCSCVTGACN